MAPVLLQPMPTWTNGFADSDAIVRVMGTRASEGLPVVVFDGDDTLWSTEPLYDRAREVAKELVGATGLDSDEWWDRQLQVDVRNVAEFGLSAERFPTSSVQAFDELCEATGRTPDPRIRQQIWSASEAVFEAIAPVHPKADDVLLRLRPTHRIVLLTQGDPRVQAKRIDDSGLASMFDETVIVAKKSAAVLAAIVDHLAIPHDRAWMVGNSIPSDINPAVEVGMRAIWIDAHVWSHERRESLLPQATHVYAVDDLSEVPDRVRIDEAT